MNLIELPIDELHAEVIELMNSVRLRSSKENILHLKTAEFHYFRLHLYFLLEMHQKILVQNLHPKIFGHVTEKKWIEMCTRSAKIKQIIDLTIS